MTDRGLIHLEGLTRLRELFLFDTRTADTGLSHLAGLPNLEMLDLGNTDVTDESMTHVEGWPRLRALWVGGSNVTSGRALALRRAAPDLEVYNQQIYKSVTYHVPRGRAAAGAAPVTPAGRSGR